MLVEGHSTTCSAGTSCRKRDCQNCISSNFLLAPAPFVLSSINLFNHLAINFLLLCDIHANESRWEDFVNIFDGLQATFTKETLSILVSKLECFVHTSWSTWRNSRSEALTIASHNISLNCWVSTRVNDLTGFDWCDSCEVSSLESRRGKTLLCERGKHCWLVF